MQKQDLVLSTQLHQLPRRADSFIQHRLEQGCTMPDLQDGQTRAVEVKNGTAGFLKYFLWKDRRPGVKIVNHS